MTTICLIDTSYTIFYRFHATKRWYSLAHPEDTFEPDYNWFENEIFRKMFIKKFFEKFKKIEKKHKITKKIFVKDCPRSEIWRNKFIDSYKGNRINNKCIGKFFQNIYDILEKSDEIIHKHESLEADDCIYLVKKYIYEKKIKIEKIVIITSDNDLLQIIDSKTHLYSLNDKYLNDKSSGDPKLDLFIKIICGDKSDNIPGCFKKCGEKTAIKLYNDKDLLLKKFKVSPESLDRYSVNKILIDFENIPKNLQLSFYHFLDTITF